MIRWASLLFLFSTLAAATDIVLPFKYYDGPKEYEAFVFLPKFMRREFGSMDHVDLILSSLTAQDIRRNKQKSKPLVEAYRLWLKWLYDKEKLVEAATEEAMVRRMLGGDEINSSLILLLRDGKFLGSLRGFASTDEHPIPEGIVELEQPRLLDLLAPQTVAFQSQVVPLIHPSLDKPGFAEIAWDPRHKWFTGGTGYLANFTVQPGEDDDKVLWMLYSLAIASKVWERGGQSVPKTVAWPDGYASFLDTIQTYLTTWNDLAKQTGEALNPLAFRWPAGIPRRLLRSHLGVLQDRFTLTCDGETDRFRRLYQGYGFHEVYRFGDPARNFKVTLVMKATKSEFVAAFERKAVRRLQTHEPTAFRLDFIPEWSFGQTRGIGCAGEMVERVHTSSHKIEYTRLPTHSRQGPD